MLARLRPRLRALIVFGVALLGLCVLSGRQLTRPSANNHFVHMAQGWLEGRWTLPGKPPGWCDARDRAAGRCRGHTFDDWAVLWTLHLRDGREVRGYPCKTEACTARARRERIETWWVLGEGWTEIPRPEIERRADTWFVSFPPGPAVVMLPFVAVFGTKVWDVLLTCVLGALVPVVLWSLMDRERGRAGPAENEHLWAALAWTFGSSACFLAANGRVWFTAQVVGALFLALHLSAAWGFRRPALAGLWLGLAVACRPSMAFAAPFAALEWWRAGRVPKAALWFAVPLLAVGAALMTFNAVRFADPLEFGHRFLEIRWQPRMQEIGMFSAAYMERNLRCLLTLMPVVAPSFPWLRVSIHGMAASVGMPWMWAALGARRRFPQRLGLWLAVAGVAAPSLLYQNSGQLQFTYRFAVDWLPMFLLAVVFGGGARSRWFRVLVVAAVLVQVYGAWMFARQAGRLFVTDPIGWPFEHEYR